MNRYQVTLERLQEVKLTITAEDEKAACKEAERRSRCELMEPTYSYAWDVTGYLELSL